MSRIDRAGLVSKLCALADSESYSHVLMTRAEAKSAIQAPEVLRVYVSVRNDAYVQPEPGQPEKDIFRSAVSGSVCVPKSDMRYFIENALSDTLESRGARLSVRASRYRSAYRPKHDGRLMVWIG